MAESRPRIVLAEPYSPNATEKLRAVGDVISLERCDEDALVEAVAGADALVVRTRSEVTRRVLERGTNLKVIGRGGVGLDNIDVGAARKRGVAVVYTPHAATDAVADLTVGMIISLVRRMAWSEDLLRGGSFEAARAEACFREMRDLTIGIVGMGRIGQAVAKRCRNGFGCAIVYNDVRDVGWTGVAAEAVSKEALFAVSDVVSLHVPLTETTRGMIHSSALPRFKDGAILINTSRGAVVDCVAVADALARGKLGGAGFDVYDPEPLPPGHPLLSAPNTVLIPHLASRTNRGLAGMNNVVDDVIRVLRGDRPRYPAD